MIKAILFDIDGVLIDSFESNLAFYNSLLEKGGYAGPTREEYLPLIHLDMKRTIAHVSKSESVEEIERIWLMGVNREVKYPHELIKTPENVENIVKELRKKYILGIVTSRVRIGIDELPIYKELKEYFKVAVSYEDTENHKPLPDPLLFAAKELDIDPKACVYIGDTNSDVEAALAAGMKVITYPTLLDRAHGFFAHFNELPAVVELLQ